MSTSRTVATLFAVFSVVQTIRFVQAWPVTINGFAVPVWASAVAAIAFAGIAVMLWRDGQS
jgi:hypothetical protein